MIPSTDNDLQGSGTPDLRDKRHCLGSWWSGRLDPTLRRVKNNEEGSLWGSLWVYWGLSGGLSGFALPSAFVTPRQPISSCTEMDLSLFTSQYSTNFFTHFLGFDFFRRNLLKGFISFLPMSPLEFLSSSLKYQWTTRSSSVWLGSGSESLEEHARSSDTCP